MCETKSHAPNIYVCVACYYNDTLEFWLTGIHDNIVAAVCSENELGTPCF